jgi:hypothetical protein
LRGQDLNLRPSGYEDECQERRVIPFGIVGLRVGDRVALKQGHCRPDLVGAAGTIVSITGEEIDVRMDDPSPFRAFANSSGLQVFLRRHLARLPLGGAR